MDGESVGDAEQLVVQRDSLLRDQRLGAFGRPRIALSN